LGAVKSTLITRAFDSPDAETENTSPSWHLLALLSAQARNGYSNRGSVVLLRERHARAPSQDLVALLRDLTDPS